jgi:hypothetical protein
MKQSHSWDLDVTVSRVFLFEIEIEKDIFLLVLF